MTTSSPKLTDQQAKALSTDSVSIALTAGAGCGKTFVLTQRFLGYLDPKNNADEDLLSKIVAITFTDLAAREMRDRIREECQHRLDTSPLSETEHWLKILRGLDSARINTIHSFCSSLLRSHAIELGIDPTFQSLEESQSKALLKQAAREIIKELLAQNDDDCSLLILRYELAPTVQMVESVIHSRFKIRDEEIPKWENSTLLASEWWTLFQTKFIPDFFAEWLQHPSTLSLEQFLKDNTPTENNQKEKRNQILEILSQIRNQEYTLETIGELLATLNEITKSARKKAEKESWGSVDIYKEDVAPKLKVFRTWIGSSKAIEKVSPEKEQFDQAAQWGSRVWKIGRLALERYQKIKQSQGALDFDDLLIQTRNLLRDHPVARKQIAHGIRYLMLDEFQDTDPIQTEIVRFLCGDELKTGKLFLVGDIKQSIYRFRRADPEIFETVRREIPEQGRLPLSINFRSQPPVLNLVNALFPSVMGEQYEPLTPFENKIYGSPDQIEFLFAQDLETNAADGENASEELSTKELRRLEAEWIAGRIQQLLHDPTPQIRFKNPETSETELRRVEPGDIVILFRALTDVASYEEELRRAGIDYYLVGGRAFFAQQEVYDLINLCRALDEPADELALLGVLRSPFFSLSDETLFDIKDDTQTLYNSLTNHQSKQLTEQQASQVRYAHTVLKKLKSLKNRIPISDLLEKAMEKTGYDASLLFEFMGSRKLANLRKFISKATQFDSADSGALSDFVALMRDSINDAIKEELAATSPEAGNTVRLMTIHKSKGLEFPVVFAADLNRKPNPFSSSEEIHPDFGPLIQLPKIVEANKNQKDAPKNPMMAVANFYNLQAEKAENYRLLYVALTRAKDRLILSTSLIPSFKLNNSWMKLLADHFDLQTGLPKEDPLLGRTRLSHLAPSDIPKILVHLEKPTGAGHASTARSGISIEKQQASLENAHSVAFNTLSLPIPVNTSSRTQFSVTELEQADKKQQALLKAQTASHTSKTTLKTDPKVDSNTEQLTGVDARELGTLVHAVLEHIDFNATENFTDRLISTARSLRMSDAPHFLTTAQNRLETILANRFVKELQQAKQLYRETEFLLQWQNESQNGAPATILGTIDCLYQNQVGEWILLDYKTGRLEATVESALTNYGMQLALYSFAVEQFLGTLPREVKLILIRETVESVDIVWTPEILDDYRHHITNAIHFCRTN